MSRKPGHHHHKPPMSDEEQAKTQVWHSFIDTLRLLPTVGERSAADEKILDEALEKVNRLAAMYDNPQTTRAPTLPTPTINIATPSTPSSSTGALPTPGTVGKRKRRPSVSLSPAPTPIEASPHMKKDRSATPAGPPVKVKKEPYSDQLPLQAGRRVAFKVPPSDSPEAGSDEEWILVTVRRSLGDRSKYEVVDADDNKTTYQTTIRSIIPLPDASTPPHQSSHPSQVENIPKGSIVLALYPDTTAFYQATVVAAPIPGTGMGTSGSRRADPGAKRGKYVLAFVDDGDNTHEVDAKDVVPFPR